MDKQSKEMDPTRRQLLCKVAWLYYHDDHTQAEIADKLGISRVTINRLIKEARESGVVEIKVHTDFSDVFELGQQLSERFNLRDAIVTPVAEKDEELNCLLAQAAAEVLVQRLKEGATIGVGIGRTISYIPDFFHPTAPVRCRFIGLTGGLDFRQTGVPHSFNTLARLASATNGEAVYIPAPSYVAYASVKNALLSEQAVLQSLELAINCETAIFSIGTADYSALLYQYNQISDKDLDDMHQSQAVGDVLGRFFNHNGQELELDLNQRIIGLRLEELKMIPLKILVAGGKNKREALQVAVNHQFCDILVTDAVSASWLLE
ncbi:MAG: sugar-binding transcriptional regulator [Anaerolineaceae bacterium]|nr:sugar-binding transcriptional regulator [Anaerolineaceae bacterium]